MSGMLSKRIIILGLIILLGGLLRFTGLGQLPAGFHGDEAAYGYNAYSLLKTGTDEYGKRFPLILKSFEDYKPALYAYIDIPFIAIFGLTETATRIPSALFGTLTLIILYYLVKILIPSDENIPLISAFLLAISPWHIMLSRTTSEVVVSVFFIILMIYALFRLINKYSHFFILLAGFSGLLAMGSYTASRIFVFLISGLIFLYTLQKSRKKITFSKPLLCFFIFIILTEFVYNIFAVNKRFDQVSVFNNPATRLVLEEQIREDQFLPVYITRLFHNKIINYGRTIVRNYAQYFSLEFLVLDGGLPIRLHIPDTGLFYLWEIFFLLAGIYVILRHRQRSQFFLLISWLVLLIPSAITRDDVPNEYRALVILPFVIPVIALGIRIVYLEIIKLKLKYLTLILLIFITGIGLYELAYFAHQYAVHAEKHQPWNRDYAMKGLVNAMNLYAPEFRQIQITKNKSSYIQILFFNKTDPRYYQAAGSRMDKDYTGWGKYIFIPKECLLTYDEKKQTVTGNPDILYVSAGTCDIPPENVKLLTTVNWQDGSAAFKLMQYIN
jgi:4-amino-4-deoxy-L-arabinose transferase-like glycosyltransferase